MLPQPSPATADDASALEALAPPRLAQEWDNVGLLIGDACGSTNKLLLCIDLTAPVERAFLVRHGITRADDSLKGKFGTEPIVGGPAAGVLQPSTGSIVGRLAKDGRWARGPTESRQSHAET